MFSIFFFAVVCISLGEGAFAGFNHLQPNPFSAEKLATRQAAGSVPASEFVRRAYQSSIVVGDWLYIDGGELSYDSGGLIYEYSTTLLSIDLSQNWTNGSVVIQSNPKPSGVPNLNSPSLWYDQNTGLIYTGFAGWNSTFGGRPNLPPLSLWSFKPDGTGDGIWNETIGSNSPVWHGVLRPSEPLTAFSPTTALLLGGTDEPYEDSSSENLLRGMVQFDIQNQSFSNVTADCCNATNGIYRGAMQYVPSFGPEGVFIAMGGINGADPPNSTNYEVIPFGSVSVYDPAAKAWWNQTTTGTPPIPRIEFCVAGVNSTNQTYEIFVYGGFNGDFGNQSVQFDTVSILTLPAFHWISVPYPPEKPRNGHSCNAVGGSQIISIGGADPNVNLSILKLGNPLKYLTFNTIPDPFQQGLAIFDMTSLQFASQYIANAPPYQQSDPVKQFYSQSQQGYVAHLAPDVASLMQAKHFTNSNTSSNSTTNTTISSSSHHSTTNTTISSLSHHSTSHAGAIAGGTIGGIAGLALIALPAYLSLRNRRRAHPSEAMILEKDSDQPKPYPLELKEDGRPWEMHGTGLQELPNDEGQRLEIDGAEVQELSEEAMGRRILELEGAEVGELAGDVVAGAAASAKRAERWSLK